MNNNYKVVNDKVVVNSDEGLKIISKTKYFKEELNLENKIEKINDRIKNISIESDKLEQELDKNPAIHDVLIPAGIGLTSYGIMAHSTPNLVAYSSLINDNIHLHDELAIIISSITFVYIVVSLIKDIVKTEYINEDLDIYDRRIEKLIKKLQRKKEELILLKNKDLIEELNSYIDEIAMKTK